MTEEERQRQVNSALLDAAIKHAKEMIEQDPKNAVLYMKRLAEYQDEVKPSKG